VHCCSALLRWANTLKVDEQVFEIYTASLLDEWLILLHESVAALLRCVALFCPLPSWMNGESCPLFSCMDHCTTPLQCWINVSFCWINDSTITDSRISICVHTYYMFVQSVAVCCPLSLCMDLYTIPLPCEINDSFTMHSFCMEFWSTVAALLQHYCITVAALLQCVAVSCPLSVWTNNSCTLHSRCMNGCNVL